MAEMTIHFICRGNSFRSIIAEAYLKSRQLDGLKVTSSGTNAAADKAGNLAAYNGILRLLAAHGIQEFAKAGYGDQLTQSCLAGVDIAICMNERVRDECQRLVTLPPRTQVWSVADIGEPGRIARTETEKTMFRQEAYQEIVAAVSQLI